VWKRKITTDSLAPRRDYRQREDGWNLPFAQRSSGNEDPRVLPIFPRFPGSFSPEGKDGADSLPVSGFVCQFSSGYGGEVPGKIGGKTRRRVFSLMERTDEIVHGTVPEYPARFLVFARIAFFGLPPLSPEILLLGIGKGASP